MTSYSGNRYQAKKPIRKDRVFIAILFVVAIVLIPILIRSGCTGPAEPLTIIDDTTPPDDTTVVIDDTTLPDDTTVVIDDTTPVDVSPLDEDILEHTVADGETIADIAAVLGVSTTVLQASNRLFGDEQLQPGQRLFASLDGILHTIQSGQTLTDISVAYAIPLETLTEANDLTVGSTIFAGDRILIPGATTSFWADVVVLSKGTSSRFIWPLSGEVVSEFGPRVHPVLGNREHHDGIDLDVPEGAVVHAAAGGRVYYYGEEPGYGNLLILEHGDGYYSMYGHLEDALVAVGRYVEMGQAIALSGNTGISSGPHLHFEIRNGEFPIDPLRYLP